MLNKWLLKEGMWNRNLSGVVRFLFFFPQILVCVGKKSKDPTSTGSDTKKLKWTLNLSFTDFDYTEQQGLLQAIKEKIKSWNKEHDLFFFSSLLLFYYLVWRTYFKHNNRCKRMKCCSELLQQRICDFLLYTKTCKNNQLCAFLI